MANQPDIFPAADETVKVVDAPAEATAQAEDEKPMTAAEQRKLATDLLEQAIDETIRRQQQQILSEQNKFEMQQRLAGLFAASGYFSDLKGGNQREQIAKAMVKIQLGEAAGLSPMESMQSVYMVNGRPTIASEVRAARMKRSGYDWDIARLDDKGCTLLPKYQGKHFLLPNGKPAEVTFDEADAARAGLIAKTGSIYKTYPRNMYFARAVTNMQRWYAPEVLNGTHLLDRSEAEEMGRDDPKRPLFGKEETQDEADERQLREQLAREGLFPDADKGGGKK